MAHTESGRDANISALNAAAFVVSGAIVVTHAALVQRDNLEDTRTVAWFGPSHWKEMNQQARGGIKLNVSETQRHTSTFQLLKAAEVWKRHTSGDGISVRGSNGVKMHQHSQGQDECTQSGPAFLHVNFSHTRMSSCLN